MADLDYGELGRDVFTRVLKRYYCGVLRGLSD